jgi:hypothetical protein
LISWAQDATLSHSAYLQLPWTEQSALPAHQFLSFKKDTMSV